MNNPDYSTTNGIERTEVDDVDDVTNHCDVCGTDITGDTMYEKCDACILEERYNMQMSMQMDIDDENNEAQVG